MMQIAAKAMLPANITPPAMTGDPPEPSPEHEILVAQNGLVHLPSLVAGSDYLVKPTPR